MKIIQALKGRGVNIEDTWFHQDGPKRKVDFLPKSELFLSFSQKVCFKRVFVLKSKFLVFFFISKASFLQKKWVFFFKSVQKASFFTKEVGLSTWEVSFLRRSGSFVLSD